MPAHDVRAPGGGGYRCPARAKTGVYTGEMQIYDLRAMPLENGTIARRDYCRLPGSLEIIRSAISARKRSEASFWTVAGPGFGTCVLFVRTRA